MRTAPAGFIGYGTWESENKPNRIGIGISIACTCWACCTTTSSRLRPSARCGAAQGRGDGVYRADQGQEPEQAAAKKIEVAKAAKTPPPPKQITQRDTPAASKPKLETYVPPVQATMTPPPEQDMSEMIAKRRAAREANNPQPAPPAPAESENERALRIAKANIAGAQGRSAGGDRDDTGGIFSVDKSYHSAEVKFRGWNTNFKRNWLQQIHVEQGAEQDIETAVVKEMIKIIRKEKQGDFPWESRRLGKVVTLSARKEDERS
jgi:hypothetical protein